MSEPPKKKQRVRGEQQPSIGSFLQQSPGKKQRQQQNQKHSGSPKSAAAAASKSRGSVVNLLSSDEEDVELAAAPVASTSGDVIDLDTLDSDPEGASVNVQAKGGHAKKSSLTNSSSRKAGQLHPLFTPKAGKRKGPAENGSGGTSIELDLDDEEDTKDIKPDLSFFSKLDKGKGKGKAAAGADSPSKLVIPEAGAEPVAYPLDADIFAFDPRSDISTATWPRTAAGKLQIPYSFLVAAFVLVSATRSRLSIVTVVTNTLRTVVEYQPEMLRETVYLITNHVAPAYEGVELGIGGQVLGKALKAVSGTTQKELKLLWNQHGDFGDVAFHAKSKIRTLFASQPLTLSSLYNNLVSLTALKGSGTVNKKADIVQRMLVAAKGEEVRFLVRTLVSHLRIGAVRLTVTASLARAFCLIQGQKSEGDNTFWISPAEREGIRSLAKTAKEGKDDPKRLELMARLAKAESLVREVYVRHPNYDNIVPALLNHGLQGLSEAIPLQVGTPLSPMLGQITRDLGDVANRLEPNREFAAEWKYDGQRVQIHCERRRRGEVPAGESKLTTKKGGGQWVEGTDVYVRLFSRHLEDMTGKYPDILALMPELLSPIVVDDDGIETGVQSFIMDAEIVAIDPVTKALLTFQTLTNRARKDVNIHEVKVKVGVYAFDLMYLNGRTLISKTFRDRRDLLKTRFPPREPSSPTIARFDHVKCMEGTPSNLEPIRQFMLEAISEKCEGLMLKLLDSAAPDVETKIEDDLTDDGENGTEELDGLEEEKPALDDDDQEAGAEGEGDDEVKPGKKGRRKALLATYEPDKRVESWLKVKRDYGDLGDSLDVVPVGAWHGQGRKTGWWSPILLALYNPETGGFQALCKCISGFTDQFYKDLNERYKKGSDTCSSSLKTYVDSGLRPDVWWEPSEVWEIRGADLTLSPVYTAALGLVSAERGLSLRFPRFIKVRDDKSIEQATTPEDIAEAFRRQSDGHKPKAALEAVEAKAVDDAKGEDEDDLNGF